MSALHEQLLNASIQAALSSIEVYNKPDFKYREQTFTILNINAWELLLKAKIIKDNLEAVESLYIKRADGTYKTNRSNNALTIEITGAMKLCSLDTNIIHNLEKLIEVRDTAAHFYHDASLAYIVYVLGVASLKNYHQLVNEWFSRSLLEYNFYILPLSFSYGFETLNLLNFENKPEVISNLVRSVKSVQSALDQPSDFHFVCEVTTKLVSAKKFSESPDIIVQVDKEAPPHAIVVERLQRLTDKYPLSYRQVWEKVRKAKPHVKQTQFNSMMRKLEIKGNPKYSSYHFLSKENQDKYEIHGKLPTSHSCIYNEDAVRLLLENL